MLIDPKNTPQLPFIPIKFIITEDAEHDRLVPKVDPKEELENKDEEEK